MDKQIKRKSLAFPDSQYENITSSSNDHSGLKKLNERPIYKHRSLGIPILEISTSDNGKLSIFFNLRKELSYSIISAVFLAT